MTQPSDFVNKDHPTKACQLHKSLYDLRQSPQAWYDRLSQFLISIGFISTCSDTSLFCQISGSSQLFMLIYVDDIMIMGLSSMEISKLITTLSSEFKLKDMGNLQYFLDIEFIHDKNSNTY